jgi:hypothetical protein
MKKRMMEEKMSRKGIPLYKGFLDSCSSLKMLDMNGLNKIPNSNKISAIIGNDFGKGVMILSSSIIDPLAFSRKT